MSGLPACPVCKQPTFRTVVHPLSEKAVPLWPRPDTVYAIQRDPTRPGNVIPGVGYCAEHAPAVGQSGTHGEIVLYESPDDRYAARRTASYRAWLAAWLRDEIRMDDPAPVLRQWDEDVLATSKILDLDALPVEAKARIMDTLTTTYRDDPTTSESRPHGDSDGRGSAG